MTPSGTGGGGARVDPRFKIRPGERIGLAVTDDRFHFVDPATSESIAS